MGAGDIQVFVVTYNRPDYLALQLETLAAQTAKPASITVLDDGPNPETRRVAERFASAGIGYEHTDRPGLWGNIYEAQQRAETKYVAVFHDDDKTHPRYLELAGKAVDKDPSISLIGCVGTNRPPDVDPCFGEVDDLGWKFDSRTFAASFVSGMGTHFPFYIYRTEEFKKLDIYKYLDYNGPYGKWGDSAFVPLAVGDGNAIMFRSILASYGCHPGQAVRGRDDLPDVRCWARIEAVFAKLIGDSIGDIHGFTYAARNYGRLKRGYKRRGIKTISFKDYIDFAEKEGALVKWAKLLRPLGNHAVEKFLIWNYRRRLAGELTHLA